MKIIISGGGTGGHIFPAIAIANEIKKRYPHADILFVGAERRMEMKRVPEAGYQIIGLPVRGFDRRRPWRNFKVLFKLMKSIRMAKKVIRDFKPDVVVGVGGYASAPVLKAAQKAGIPTVIQEQNSYAGVTNRMLAKKADVICVAYDGMEAAFPADRIVLTGNPVRAQITDNAMSRSEAKKALGFDPQKPLLLVVGGSLGSRTLNRAMLTSLKALGSAGISVLWQCGRQYSETCRRGAMDYPDIKAEHFIKDMGTAYRAADLVVARAGASTISELQLAGLPAILVPSPNVAEDHQRKNAMALVDKDAAVMITDNTAIDLLGKTVLELIKDPKRLETLSRNISAMSRPDATSDIVDHVERLAKH